MPWKSIFDVLDGLRVGFIDESYGPVITPGEPGFPNDVEVSVADGVVTISGSGVDDNSFDGQFWAVESPEWFPASRLRIRDVSYSGNNDNEEAAIIIAMLDSPDWENQFIILNDVNGTVDYVPNPVEFEEIQSDEISKIGVILRTGLS